MKKNYIDFTNSTHKQRQLLRPLNNLENGPSEIERTYYIRKQQTKMGEEHRPGKGDTELE